MVTDICLYLPCSKHEFERVEQALRNNRQERKAKAFTAQEYFAGGVRRA